MSRILVIGELADGAPSAHTLSALTAAGKIGGEISLLAAAGLDLAETLAPAIANLGAEYTHIIAPANSVGRDLMPRVAALIDVSQVTDVVEIVAPDTFKRPVYAGNAIATVKALDKTVIMTVRTTAFPAAAGVLCRPIGRTDGSGLESPLGGGRTGGDVRNRAGRGVLHPVRRVSAPV